MANSSVLILGAGGLGCPAAIYLAAAGIGHLGVVDYDVVELSNLHRQIMHREASVGVSKAASLAQAVRSLNSRVRVTVHDVQLDGSNAMGIVSGYDVALDCSDNPATRYLINDACVLSGRPLISGSALRWEGQLTVSITETDLVTVVSTRRHPIPSLSPIARTAESSEQVTCRQHVSINSNR